MKKLVKPILITFLLVISIAANAQYLGLQLAAGSSTASDGNDEYTSIKGFKNETVGFIGLEYEQILNTSSSLCTGVYIKGKGFKYKTDEGEPQLNSSFLSVPLTFDYKFHLTDQVRYYIGAGGFYEYLLDDGFTEKSYISNGIINRNQFGITAKTGFELYNLKIGITLDQSLKAYSAYGEKLRAFFFSVGYRFGGAPRYYHSNVRTTNL